MKAVYARRAGSTVPKGFWIGKACGIPTCGDEIHGLGLCKRHWSQKRKAQVSTAEFIAAFARQNGQCPYCLDPLDTRFEVDHFHGECGPPHGDADMCRQCVRGMIHHPCNVELKWIDEALAAGQIDELAPHVLAYLAARPFLSAVAA